MKKKITEATLRQIVAESIQKVLKESLDEISPEYAAGAYVAARKQGLKAAQDGNHMLYKKRKEQADKFGDYAKDKFNQESGFNDGVNGQYGIDDYGYNLTDDSGFVNTSAIASNTRGGRSNFRTDGTQKHDMDNDADFTRGQQNKIIRGNDRIGKFMAPPADNELEEAVSKSIKKVVKESAQGFWNYDNCYNEAKKYKSRAEFSRGNMGAYHAAVRNGWMKDYTWFNKQ